MGQIHDLQDFIDFSVDMYTDLGDRLSVVEADLAKPPKIAYPVTVPRGDAIESTTYTPSGPGRTGQGWLLSGDGYIVSKTNTILGGLTVVTGTLDLRNCKVLGLKELVQALNLGGTTFLPGFKLAWAASETSNVANAWDTPTTTSPSFPGAGLGHPTDLYEQAGTRWVLTDKNTAGKLISKLEAVQDASLYLTHFDITQQVFSDPGFANGSSNFSVAGTSATGNAAAGLGAGLDSDGSIRALFSLSAQPQSTDFSSSISSEVDILGGAFSSPYGRLSYTQWITQDGAAGNAIVGNVDIGTGAPDTGAPEAHVYIVSNSSGQHAELKVAEAAGEVCYFGNGTAGIFGSRMSGKAAHPTTLADVIAIIQAFGACS